LFWQPSPWVLQKALPPDRKQPPAVQVLTDEEEELVMGRQTLGPNGQ